MFIIRSPCIPFMLGHIKMSDFSLGLLFYLFILQHSGLPPMSEAEAHAFEVSTNDLYNEIAGLAELGVPNGDGFSPSNAGVTEQQPTYFGVPNSENYVNMDDIFAPDTRLSYAYPLPNNQFWHYPMDQFTYSTTLSAAFPSGDSRPTMRIVDDLPAAANNGGFASKPSMQFPLS